MSNQWTFTNNKPPNYWFGDRVYHHRFQTVGVIVGLVWSQKKDGEAYWLYMVIFDDFKRKTKYYCYTNDLEPR